jgi:hypothetical protein
VGPFAAAFVRAAGFFEDAAFPRAFAADFFSPADFFAAAFFAIRSSAQIPVTVFKFRWNVAGRST